ncbi:MAG: lipid-binding SYLF domain-containing protein [Candidatus Omnitrophica bacterium]|nr:lipid-binding SYLF domain-containing protein [Candidatus Omnitrophota bacterium]
MKKFIYSFICLVMLSVQTSYCEEVPIDEGTRVTGRVIEAKKVIDQIMEVPEKGIPKQFFGQCSAIAIFPSVFKGGFIFADKYGQGVITAYNKEKQEWSNPAFFTISEAIFGFQVGVEATDLVLVIFGDDSLQGLFKDKLNLGTDILVENGPVGNISDVNSDILVKGGVFSYSQNKGVFSGVSLKGATMTPNNIANRDYYNEDVTVKELFFEENKKLVLPNSCLELKKTLDKYTDKVFPDEVQN